MVNSDLRPTDESLPVPREAAARRPRAARLPPEERRALLLEAAVRVFARRGIGAARPSEIAEDAGVSEATIYTYFPTRADLRAAVLSEVAGYYDRLTRDCLERGEGPIEERLSELIERVARSVERDPDHARVWINWGSAIRDETWRAFLDNEEHLVGRVMAAIEAAPAAERDRLVRRGHPADLARLIIGTGESVARQKFAGRPSETIDRFVASARAMLFGTRPADDA